MKNVPSVKSYVDFCVNTYPNLYYSNSYEVSKFAILDQLLNTIGNGIGNDEELSEDLSRVLDVSNPERYYDESNPLFIGYTKVKNIAGMDYPDYGEESVYCFENDKKDYKDVKLWRELERLCDLIMPYPNFSKEYSLVWRCPYFLVLGNDWIEAAIWFYKKSKEILSQRESEYHYAFPCYTERETSNRIYAYSQTIKDLTHEEVTKKFNHPFDGDVEKFLTSMWHKDKERIFSFIDETIEMLESHLTK